jgi:hypothetical protein
MIKIIGDPHGKLSEYVQIVLNAERFGEKTLTVGDNGFLQNWAAGEHFLAGLDGGFENHKWLGGNHDIYPNTQFKQSLSDYGIWQGIFYIRGAYSIDRAKRIEGVDWYREEELNYSEMLSCMEMWEKEKPNYVVSHACPQSVQEKCFNITDRSSTSIFLQELFEIHQPKIWVFGHFHRTVITNEKNTSFVCLAELQTINIIIK